MHTLLDSIRRYTPLGMALLMLTVSVAVPVLGSADLVTEPVAESGHSPADCPMGHDHTICTQVGATFSAVSGSLAYPVMQAVVGLTSTTRTTRMTDRALEEGHPSRAPPQA